LRWKNGKSGSTARGIRPGAATASSQPGHESRTAGDASRMVKRASISDEAFSRDCESGGSNRSSPLLVPALQTLASPEGSSSTDQEWVLLMDCDKLQTACCQRISACRVLIPVPPTSRGSLLLAHTLAGLCQICSTRTQAAHFRFVYTGGLCAFVSNRSRGLHASTRSRSRSLASLPSDGANSGPVPCHRGRQGGGVSCGRSARLVRLVFPRFVALR
jgi:hypothetical protein